MGVSGFLISCATWRAISPQASTRSARETSVTSLRAITTPRTSGPSEASWNEIRRPPTSSSAVASAVGSARNRRTAAVNGAPLAVEPVEQRRALLQLGPDQVHGLAVGDQHAPRRVDADDAGGDRAQHGGSAATGFLQRSLTASDVGGHALEGAEYRLELERRTGRRAPAWAARGRSASAERRSSATGRESVRDARCAPTSAAATPASVVSSSTRARSSCRTASEESSASCGVASTPMSAGPPAGPRGTRPARRAAGWSPPG